MGGTSGSSRDPAGWADRAPALMKSSPYVDIPGGARSQATGLRVRAQPSLPEPSVCATVTSSRSPTADYGPSQRGWSNPASAHRSPTSVSNSRSRVAERCRSDDASLPTRGGDLGTDPQAAPPGRRSDVVSRRASFPTSRGLSQGNPRFTYDLLLFMMEIAAAGWSVIRKGRG
jgi:hypothetical protein